MAFHGALDIRYAFAVKPLETVVVTEMGIGNGNKGKPVRGLLSRGQAEVQVRSPDIFEESGRAIISQGYHILRRDSYADSPCKGIRIKEISPF